MDRINSAILSTLIYSDIFDYPLTKEELWKYLISKENIPRKLFNTVIAGQSVTKTLPYISSSLVKQTGSFVCLRVGELKGWVTIFPFFCLRGREHIIQKRIEREKISEKKIIIAKKYAKVLSVIPTVQLIGISGSLSMKNADQKDDVDFFIITKKRTIWLTRLLILLLLQVIGRRRKRTDAYNANKICVNLLFDESDLHFSKERQNLYTAHEIVQMKPLFIRATTYSGFLFANKWITEFLPNVLEIATERQSDRATTRKYTKNRFVAFVEFIAKHLQLAYMRKHRTKEIITDTILAFHPEDKKDKVLGDFNKKIELLSKQR